MKLFKLREGGPFAIESYSKLQVEANGIKHITTECVTVYADRDQPTHSVRLWIWNEE